MKSNQRKSHLHEVTEVETILNNDKVATVYKLLQEACLNWWRHLTKHGRRCRIKGSVQTCIINIFKLVNRCLGVDDHDLFGRGFLSIHEREMVTVSVT